MILIGGETSAQLAADDDDDGDPAPA